ncbi:alpha/beta fold hydrolase [Georgenia thermotolerans]|uniref:Alpha/beta fold hydrolase n=1 Tax=Georgenia thermotolerans TaxID=527326 RepID=A0A7J5UME1_9MICO|nr:alpha/beta fold hydrolase [Georgenia thermotolerans]KAE8763527.1 alpha/beta fold hydrolase [Georgenia thermotolerans]
MSRLSQVRRGRLLFDVRDEGPVDGEAVLLLHGFPEDAASWDRVAPLLHGEGLRTLALDQRGYSPGARPLERAAYRMPWLVADAMAVLDAAGLARVHLVGHDWGAGVAWAAAAAHPARVASLTVLATPHPRAFVWALSHSAQPLRSWYMGLFQLPALPEALLRPRLEALLADGGLPAADAARYAARMREPGALRAALNWYRAMPLARGLPGAVEIPTTYLWGVHDPAIDAAAAERSEHHVAAPYRSLALDAGHWLPETRHEEVAEAVLHRVRAAAR